MRFQRTKSCYLRGRARAFLRVTCEKVVDCGHLVGLGEQIIEWRSRKSKVGTAGEHESAPKSVSAQGLAPLRRIPPWDKSSEWLTFRIWTPERCGFQCTGSSLCGGRLGSRLATGNQAPGQSWQHGDRLKRQRQARMAILSSAKSSSFTQRKMLPPVRVANRVTPSLAQSSRTTELQFVQICGSAKRIKSRLKSFNLMDPNSKEYACNFQHSSPSKI